MKTLSFVTILMVLPLFIFSQQGFLENKGQWHSEALFKFENGPNLMFVDKSGYTVQMYHPGDYENRRNQQHTHSLSNGSITGTNELNDSLRYHVYKVKFKGADFSKPAIKEHPLTGYENFFIGNNPARWASECRTYQTVTFKNIYNKIDLVYYYNGQQLKYDIIVHPGGNSNDIKLEYHGADNLELIDNNLIVQTSTGNVTELKPFTYQQNNQQKIQVASQYQLNRNTVSFEIGAYDHSRPLIIDPSLIFSSFTGTTSVVWGYTATYAADGSMYAAGITAPTGFPVSTGAFQQSGNGGSNNQPSDIGIIKLSPDGSTRIYATYLGGTGLEQPHSLLADADGNLIINGRTNSVNFPFTNQFGTFGGYDLFFTKLNAGGTAITGSIRIGGSADDGVNITADNASGTQSLFRNYGDDSRSEMIFGNNNEILFAGCTRSSNFFTKNGFQTGPWALQEGVVIKVNAAVTDIIWSTYFGGNGDDGAFSIAKSTNNTLYISGGTTSASLPGIVPGAFQITKAGGETEGFCAKLTDNGSSVTLDITTFFGTTGNDIIYGLQTDADGDVYIMGTTTGTVQLVNAFYNSPNSRQFITKIWPNLGGLYYATTFGVSGATAPNIVPNTFFVDRCENVYVTGWGGGANTFGNPIFPNSGTTGMFISADALQSQTDGSDFYIFVLQKDAMAPLYGSYFGQIGGNGGFDHTHAKSRFSNDGVLYLATCANCKSVTTNQPLISNYPVTTGAFAVTNNATSIGACDLGLVKMNLDFTTGCTTTNTSNIFSNSKKEKLVATPNPNKGYFKLSFYHSVSGSSNTLRIIDMSGKKVFEQSFKATNYLNEFELQLPSIHHGMYIAEIISASGNKMASCKFLIQ